MLKKILKLQLWSNACRNMWTRSHLRQFGKIGGFGVVAWKRRCMTAVEISNFSEMFVICTLCFLFSLVFFSSWVAYLYHPSWFFCGPSEDFCWEESPTQLCDAMKQFGGKKGLEIGGFRAMFRFQTVGTAVDGSEIRRSPVRLVVEIPLFPVF